VNFISLDICSLTKLLKKSAVFRITFCHLGGLINKRPMKTMNKTKDSGQRLFDQFIQAVLNRQKLENEYWQTGDQEYVDKIDKARENIHQVLREMGVRTLM
jgi:hypothetical protein